MTSCPARLDPVSPLFPFSPRRRGGYVLYWLHRNSTNRIDSTDMHIRDEQPGDVDAIAALIQSASRANAHGGHNHHRIVDNLRRSGALALSLVAEDEDELVGHIAFSEVEISDGSTDWYGLGPLTVKPTLQGRGIGSGLVRAGLDRLRRQGAKGCVLAGDPSFFRRFGFAYDPDLMLEEASQEHFLVLTLRGPSAHGVVAFHRSFFNGC